MTEPHPLDPDSKLSPEERVLFSVLSAKDVYGDSWDWAVAAEASSFVSTIHAEGAHVCVGRDCPHPSHRGPLPSEARARSGDPQTSKQAALTIDNMTDRHRAVLRMASSFRQPFSYDELIDRYNRRSAEGHHPFAAATGPAQEPSSIRSRCAELRRAGFIVEAGRGMSDAGRPCNLWTVA